MQKSNLRTIMDQSTSKTVEKYSSDLRIYYSRFYSECESAARHGRNELKYTLNTKIDIYDNPYFCDYESALAVKNLLEKRLENEEFITKKISIVTSSRNGVKLTFSGKCVEDKKKQIPVYQLLFEVTW